MLKREKITGREEKSQSSLDTKWYVNKLQQKKPKILFSEQFIYSEIEICS